MTCPRCQEVRYGSELDQAAALLQAVHPIGKIKAIGRLEVVQALREVLANVDALKASAQAWVDYMDSLDQHAEPGDRIAALRRTFHGPRVEQTRLALAPFEV